MKKLMQTNEGWLIWKEGKWQVIEQEELKEMFKEEFQDLLQENNDQVLLTEDVDSEVITYSLNLLSKAKKAVDARVLKWNKNSNGYWDYEESNEVIESPDVTYQDGVLVISGENVSYAFEMNEDFIERIYFDYHGNLVTGIDEEGNLLTNGNLIFDYRNPDKPDVYYTVSITFFMLKQ